MSNYMVIISAQHLDSRVDEWLTSRGATQGQDVVIDRRASGYSLCFIAHDAESSYDSSGKFFKGNLVDYVSGSVVFGLNGFKRWPRLKRSSVDVEGQYVRVDWHDAEVRVSRDLFGQVVGLYSQGRGYVVVSDSMLAIVDFRRFLGEPCTPNREVMLSRAILNNVAHQQLGVDTFVQEVSFLPASKSLRIDFNGDFIVRQAGEGVIDRFTGGTNPGDYEDRLRRAAIFTASLLSTLADIDSWQVNIALSGGYDSRAVLAAALAADVLEVINLNCRNANSAQSADFAVASMLGSVFDFELNVPRTAVPSRPGRPVRCTALGLWGLSSLGVYDVITMRHASQLKANAFNLNGIGAELSKGNYGWKSWAELSGEFAGADRPIRDAFRAQGEQGLSVLGVDAGRDDASEWHYLGYRNGLHGGRGVPLGMVGFTPLGSQALVAASRSRDNPFRKPLGDGPSVITDLTSVLSPIAALLPYDRVAKRLSFSHVADRVRALGGQIGSASIAKLALYGRPEDVAAGPPGLFVNIAQAYGLNVPIDSDDIINRARQGLAITEEDAELFAAYEPLFRRVKWRLKDKGQSPIGRGGEIGKLLAIGTLFS